MVDYRKIIFNGLAIIDLGDCEARAIITLELNPIFEIICKPRSLHKFHT